LRLWSVLERIVSRASEVDAIEALVAIGSLARGDVDELSDVDLLAAVAPGRFHDAWDSRLELVDDALLTWEPQSTPSPHVRWFTWLTRDLVKVECGIVDPRSGERDLAEPFVVLAGDPRAIELFPRITPAELVERRRKRRLPQRAPDDENELPYGPLIDWKLWELKNAVRRGLRES